MSTFESAVTMVWVSELIALGRLRVIRPTPWSTRVRISSDSVVKRASFGAAAANYYDILVLSGDGPELGLVTIAVSNLDRSPAQHARG